MNNDIFKSLSDLLKCFPDEQSCIAHLEALRWQGIVTSPFDPASQVYYCKGGKYRCRNTGKYFNVRTNTIFSSSRIALQKWFIAMWIVTQNDKITSIALGNELNVTQKTAWYMLRRIKKYLALSGSENILSKDINSEPAKIAVEILVHNEKLEMTEWLKLLKK